MKGESIMAKIDLKTVGTFVGGVLFGTAGLKILGSDDAKKVYTNCRHACERLCYEDGKHRSGKRWRHRSRSRTDQRRKTGSEGSS